MDGSTPDDSFVSKRRDRKSYALGCDYEVCECFGAGNLFCVKCNRSFHAECSKNDGCSFLDEQRVNLVCSKCAVGLNNLFVPSSPPTTQVTSGDFTAPAVPISMNPPASASDISKLEKNLVALLSSKFDSFNTQLLSFKKESDEHRKDLMELRNSVMLLEQRLKVVESNNSGNAVKGLAAPDPDSTCDTVASELQDRLRRANNVMFYNVPSSDDGDDKLPDLDKIKNYIQKISNIKLDAIRVRRFPRPSKFSSFPPILASFQSGEEASRIVNNRKLIPKEISVTADHTVYQRRRYKELKAIVNQHNLSAGPSYGVLKGVRYVNGTPTIVDIQPVSTDVTQDQGRPKNK